MLIYLHISNILLFVRDIRIYAHTPRKYIGQIATIPTMPTKINFERVSMAVPYQCPHDKNNANRRKIRRKINKLKIF